MTRRTEWSEEELSMMTMEQLAFEYAEYFTGNGVKYIGPVLEEARNRNLTLMDLEVIAFGSFDIDTQD